MKKKCSCDHAKEGKRLQSGIVVDKNTNMAKIIQDFNPIDSFPVITGTNSLSDKRHQYSLEEMPGHPEKWNTPSGEYTLQPYSNIFGYKGFEVDKNSIAKNIAVHQTYPKEFDKRNPTYKSKNPRDRDLSWGCINCRKEDIDKLYKYFPKGDTLRVNPRINTIIPKEEYIQGQPNISELEEQITKNYKKGGRIDTRKEHISKRYANPIDFINPLPIINEKGFPEVTIIQDPSEINVSPFVPVIRNNEWYSNQQGIGLDADNFDALYNEIGERKYKQGGKVKQNSPIKIDSATDPKLLSYQDSLQTAVNYPKSIDAGKEFFRIHNDTVTKETFDEGRKAIGDKFPYNPRLLGRNLDKVLGTVRDSAHKYRTIYEKEVSYPVQPYELNLPKKKIDRLTANNSANRWMPNQVQIPSFSPLTRDEGWYSNNQGVNIDSDNIEQLYNEDGSRKYKDGGKIKQNSPIYVSDPKEFAIRRTAYDDSLKAAQWSDLEEGIYSHPNAAFDKITPLPKLTWMGEGYELNGKPSVIKNQWKKSYPQSKMQPNEWKGYNRYAARIENTNGNITKILPEISENIYIAKYKEPFQPIKLGDKIDRIYNNNQTPPYQPQQVQVPPYTPVDRTQEWYSNNQNVPIDAEDFSSLYNEGGTRKYQNGGSMKKKKYAQDGIEQPNEQKQFIDIKDPTNFNNWNPNGGVNTNNIFAGALGAISGLLPNQPVQNTNINPLQQANNPFPNGTNFRKGGKIKYRKAENGSQLTSADRDAWEAMQSAAYQQGFRGDNHSQQPGVDFMQQNGIDPSKLAAYQADFQNFSQNDPSRIRNGNEGLSGVDNFYGSKTSQQRYRKYAIQHNDEKLQPFGTNAEAFTQASNNILNNGFENFDKPPVNVNYQEPIVEQTQQQNSYQPLSNAQYAENRRLREQDTTGKYKNMYKGRKSRDQHEYSVDAVREEYAYGGQVPIGEQGLQIEDDKYTMLSPNTAMIEGNSHEEGGTDVSFQGNEIEAEKGEPISIGNDGQAVIFGNMVVPGTNTKFKHAAKYIAKEEKKNDKVEKKGTRLLNKANAFNYYEGPSFNTGKVLHDAAMQKEIALNKEKERLANIQQTMLNVAEGLGKDPKEISKMGKSKAKYGIKFPKAEDGKRLKRNTLYDIEGLDMKGIENSTNNKDYNLYGRPSYENPLFNTSTFNEPPIEPLSINSPVEKPINLVNEYSPKPVNIPEFTPTFDNPSLKDSDKKKFKSYKNRLRATDFLSEIPDIFDQQQQVARQQFTPNLYTPYSVSFDDRMAANQGDFNSLQNTLRDNPSALGALSAQKYNANNQIKADEFRTNQGIQNDVINKNIGLINQAEQINMQSADQQTVRQAQAYENTKANRNAALTSIANKIASNRSENAKNKLYSDLYHYGYDPSKGFYHDDNYQAIIRATGSNMADLNPDTKTKTKKYTRDSKGKVSQEDTKTDKYGGKMKSKKYTC